MPEVKAVFCEGVLDGPCHQAISPSKFPAGRFTLDGDSLVKCLQNTPSCAAMFFEYAKEFTMAVKKRLGG